MKPFRLYQSLVVLILLALLALIATQEPFYSALYFEAEQVAQGQLWRPYTAWLVQANVEHWLVNLWGLVVMAIVLPKQLSKADLVGYAAIWLLSSLMLWRSDYQAYVGLSGVLYGLLIWAVAQSPYYQVSLKALVIGVIALKVSIENSNIDWFQEAWLAQWIGSEIAHESHAWGAISGLIVILVSWLLRQFSSNVEPLD